MKHEEKANAPDPVKANATAVAPAIAALARDVLGKSGNVTV